MQKMKDIKENEIATLAFSKFAMTEGENKSRKIQRMDSRLRGNDIRSAGITQRMCPDDIERAGMT